LPFYITSTVIDTHELMGFVDGHGVYHRTPFREAYENGGVWVADEIDAWDAAALLTANSALANGIATFPDSHTPVKRHPDFRMIATANTFGHGADRVYIGRNELDAASLDRFAVIAIDYDTTLEQALSNGNPLWLNRVWQVREQVQSRNIRHVVSTRAIINGSIALSVGIPQREVEEMYLFKGMSKSDREKIR
jgi:cobaltochelatase CobS